MRQTIIIVIVLFLSYSLARLIVKSFKVGLVYIPPKSYSKERSPYIYRFVQIGRILALIFVILAFLFYYSEFNEDIHVHRGLRGMKF